MAQCGDPTKDGGGEFAAHRQLSGGPVGGGHLRTVARVYPADDLGEDVGGVEAVQLASGVTARRWERRFEQTLDVVRDDVGAAVTDRVDLAIDSNVSVPQVLTPSRRSGW